jgi:hypothetical protein
MIDAAVTGAFHRDTLGKRQGRHMADYGLMLVQYDTISRENNASIHTTSHHAWYVVLSDRIGVGSHLCSTRPPN